jgi:hypothetical protein
MHPQPRAGRLHDPAGQPVVVDVGVCHQDAGHVGQLVPGRLEALPQAGQAVVAAPGAPDPAVDQRDAVGIGEHVTVDRLDPVYADRQRQPGHAG